MTPVKELLGTHGGNAVRGLKFAPSDAKFCSCADDGTVRVWDWELFKEERILAGHGWDVKTCDWHPQWRRGARVGSGRSGSRRRRGGRSRRRRRGGGRVDAAAGAVSSTPRGRTRRRRGG